MENSQKIRLWWPLKCNLCLSNLLACQLEDTTRIYPRRFTLYLFAITEGKTWGEIDPLQQLFQTLQESNKSITVSEVLQFTAMEIMHTPKSPTQVSAEKPDKFFFLWDPWEGWVWKESTEHAGPSWVELPIFSEKHQDEFHNSCALGQFWDDDRLLMA